MSTKSPNFQKKKIGEKTFNIIWTKHLILQMRKLSLSRDIKKLIRERDKIRGYDSKSN